MEKEYRKFVSEWIEAWNSHDLDRILSHYSEDFEITTPMIKVATGNETGCMKGKKNIREYWKTALKKIPDLSFELEDYATGLDSLAVYYKSVMGKMAIEVMFFDEEGKITKVIAHYR